MLLIGSRSQSSNPSHTMVHVVHEPETRLSLFIYINSSVRRILVFSKGSIDRSEVRISTSCVLLDP